MASLDKITSFLDVELNISEFDDYSNNGLQIQNSGTVHKVCCGVDASMEFFQHAQKMGADLLICHHGLSWSDSLKYITDLNYERISFLMKHNMALYAAHLPLDAHPVYGNNKLICKALGLKKLKKFGLYRNKEIGFRGEYLSSMSYLGFKKLVKSKIGKDIRTMDFGKKTIKSVAVISGGAADEVAEAGKLGVDVYLSGEGKLSAYNLAQEYNINAIFAGHYATEVFGVRALSKLVAGKFRIKADFVDLGIKW